MNQALRSESGVRLAQHVHPWRAPVLPLPAATLLLLRDTSDGVEVLMTRRSTKASFAPGAFVFPGGVVDPSDALAQGLDPALLEPARLACWQSLSRLEHRQLHQVYAQAAVRECWEELQILLAKSSSDGERINAAGLNERMDGLQRQPAEGFSQALFKRGLVAAIDQVRSFSHWTTDRDLAKRFDVRFLVARAPEGQVAVADEGEQFEPCWVRPNEALARHVQGSFLMIFPTIKTLEQLVRFQTVDQVVKQAEQSFEEGRLWRSCPRGAYLASKEVRFTEDDMPFAELELVCPDGQLLHPIDWQHDKPVALLRYLYRYTAGNPGRMTGPGTNTYLLGQPGNWTVIDPGPDLAAHVQGIRAFTKDQITRILCTHSHLDHSPAAFSLQAAIQDANGLHVPILGRASGPSVDANQAFSPDQTLEDGDLIAVCDEVHLRVIHTPGHASNHLCFLIEEDGILLTGDHVMNGSTVVINPPDGDMQAYIDSLKRLERLDLNYILPAHGYVLGAPAREIRKLIDHRLLRESKVLESLRRLCDAGDSSEAFSVEAIVPGAYPDVPAALYPLAARSLLAHLLKLEHDGQVLQSGQGWQIA